ESVLHTPGTGWWTSSARSAPTAAAPSNQASVWQVRRRRGSIFDTPRTEWLTLSARSLPTVLHHEPSERHQGIEAAEFCLVRTRQGRDGRLCQQEVHSP
ncbi:unnamed protein product, partial [Pylaiella littoralis]